jgi:hypothetical protein
MLMSVKEWKRWFFHLHWSLKWFIVLVLIRPVIDNFYYLKEVSPFFSPLYIVGVLTPVLCIYSIYQVKKPNYSRLDTYVGIFSILIIISCIGLMIRDAFSLDSIEYAIKLSFPVYFYYFCRRLIRSKEDLHGVMQAFLYSSIVVFAIFLYELIYNPINIAISRGMERFQGSYADSMNYAIYMTCGLIIVCYLIIEKSKKISLASKILLLTVVTTIVFLILFKINHTASYAVVVATLLIFVFHNIKSNFGFGLLLISSTLILATFFGFETIESKIKPLIETDIKVYEGEKESETLLHGRVGRWMNFIDVFQQESTITQFLGLPVGLDKPYMYITKGSHNDFVRTLMFTGYLGLIIYVLILLNLVGRIKKHNTSMHFLGIACLAAMCLYSISTTPMLYPPMMYVFFPVFCVLALPKQAMD